MNIDRHRQSKAENGEDGAVVGSRTRARISRTRGPLALAGVVAVSFLLHPGTGSAESAVVAPPSVQQQFWVPSTVDSDDDGTPDLIHLAVTRPDLPAESEVPVVVQINGAVSEPGAASLLVARADQRRTAGWLAAGFAVVTVDNPGIGRSAGCTDSGGAVDLAAGTAAINFLTGDSPGYTDPAQTDPADVDWSNGRVAVVGGIRSGSHPVALAAAAISGLEAVISLDDLADQYPRYRPGSAEADLYGAPEAGRSITEVPLTQPCAAVAEKTVAAAAAPIPKAADDRAKPASDRNTFWQNRSYLAEAKIAAPTLILQSVVDRVVGTEQAVAIDRAATAAKVPHQLNLVADATDPAQDAAIIAWLTSYLVGPPPVAIDPVRVERSGTPDVRVDTYPAWPDPAAAPVRLVGTPDGSLSRSAAGQAGPSADAVLPSYSLTRLLRTAPGADLPGATLLSTPLAADLRISGSVSLDLTVTTPAALGGTPLTAALLAIPAAGDARLVAAQIADPGTADEAGSLGLTLDPADVVIARGSRLALVLFSGVPEQGRTVPPVAVDPRGIRLDLPVVGGVDAADAALAVPTTPTTEGPTTVPETTGPGTSGPVTTTAPAEPTDGGDVPGTTAPGTTAPETTAPGTTAPETTAPETTAPETTAPETTVPDTSAPSTGQTPVDPSPVGPSTPPTDCFPVAGTEVEGTVIDLAAATSIDAVDAPDTGTVDTGTVDTGTVDTGTVDTG
ncbi:hypothetical protein D1871_01085, partial [Nakamurella silvestris]